MKKLAIWLTALLLLSALCACTAQQADTGPAQTDTGPAQTGIGAVMYEDEVYNIPEETTGVALSGYDLQDAKVLEPGQTPAENGEVSLREDLQGKSVRICPLEDGTFLVIVDEKQYLVRR